MIVEGQQQLHGKLFDPKKPAIYIINLNVNKLNGKAMSNPMPHSGFTWRTEEKWNKLDWVAQREDQYIGYFDECVLEAPSDLHDSHND